MCCAWNGSIRIDMSNTHVYTRTRAGTSCVCTRWVKPVSTKQNRWVLLSVIKNPHIKQATWRHTHAPHAAVPSIAHGHAPPRHASWRTLPSAPCWSRLRRKKRMRVRPLKSPSTAERRAKTNKSLAATSLRHSVWQPLVRRPYRQRCRFSGQRQVSFASISHVHACLVCA